MHIVSIVGARPNFIKIAALERVIVKRPDIKYTLIHTGQHYDDKLSDSFFNVLNIRKPDFNLGIGSAPHGVQTGRIMIELEPLLNELRPHWVLTVGDVNSTAAAALVAVKLGLKTAHIEAGLRSFDRTMPEEINRLVTDSISDLLFVTEQSGLDNLLREGVPLDKIKFVGNVMIDTLINLLPLVEMEKFWEKLNLEPYKYITVTLHRPSNVDNPEMLEELMNSLIEIADKYPVVFPVHPRTRNNFVNFGLAERLSHFPNLLLTEPLNYISFLSLVSNSLALMTDSGGIQEETTYLGVPCLTLRDNTERPVTVDIGTNTIAHPCRESIINAFDSLTAGKWKKGSIPPLWDGKAADRILNILSAEV